MWLQTAFMLNLVWKNQEVDHLNPVNLKKAPQTHLKQAEQVAEHPPMAPVALLAEQELHQVELLLYQVEQKMTETEATVMK